MCPPTARWERRAPRRNVRIPARTLAACLLAAASTALAAAPPAKPKPAAEQPNPKPPEQVAREQFEQQSDAIDADLALARDFTVTFDKTKPEEAAAAASKSEAAKFSLSVAAASVADAKRLQVEAAAMEAKGMSGLAYNLRAEAREKLTSARGSIERARGIVGNSSAAPPTTGSARSPLVGDACSGKNVACTQLKLIGKLTPGSGSGEFAIPLAPEEADLPGPGPDRYFQGRFETAPKLSPDSSQLTLPNGEHFAPGELRDAVAAIAPEVAAKPLFELCEGKPCPSRELLRLVADPAKREALRSIGGVSLDATFEVLAEAGMSELRGGMDLAYIDRPVLVSLKALLAAASPAVSDWDNLADSIRYPGNLGRVHGFVLASDGGDVFLVGSAASSPESRIDIDELVLMLRTIWRDGQSPAVSLDPRPDQFGGPQYPRVIDQPVDSVVASIMLEADYAMKAINLDAAWAEGEELTGFRALLAGRPNYLSPSLSRFWLSPRPLGARQVYRSAGGRTVLFETGVQVQTEALFLQHGQLTGTGAGNDFDEAQAEAFTRAYPRLEGEPRVQPASIFARLHGLVDLAVLARGLRGLGVAGPVLEGLAQLPYRRLSGDRAIPSYYDGLHGSPFEQGARAFRFEGGAELATSTSLKTSVAWRDHVGSSLEAAADRWTGGIAAALPNGFGIPLSGSQVEASGDAVLLAANRSLAQGEWRAAEREFRAYIVRNAERPAGYQGLAQALIGANRLGDAALPIAQALILAPDDPTNERLALDLAWRSDTSGALLVPSREARTVLARYYVGLASAATARDRVAEARQFADWAVKLDRDDGDAHLLRAFTYPPDSQTRELEIAQAVRSHRRGTGGRRLAYALTIAAQHHLMRGLAKATAGDQNGLFLLQFAQTEAGEAERLDSGLVDAATLALRSAAVTSELEHPDSPVMDKFGPRIDALGKRFPRDAEVVALLAEMLGFDDRLDEARAAIDQAVDLAPGNPVMLVRREGIAAAMGNCAAAAADYARALALAGSRAASLDLPGASPCPAQ